MSDEQMTDTEVQREINGRVLDAQTRGIRCVRYAAEQLVSDAWLTGADWAIDWIEETARIVPITVGESEIMRDLLMRIHTARRKALERHDDDKVRL